MAIRTVDGYFLGLDGAVADIALSLRGRIEALGEGLDVALAWGFPCWRGNERIVSIIAQRDRCNLQLFSGARLAADFPVIEGTGKQLRHVKVRAPVMAGEQIDAIIQAAIELDRVAPERVR